MWTTPPCLLHSSITSRWMSTSQPNVFSLKHTHTHIQMSDVKPSLEICLFRHSLPAGVEHVWQLEAVSGERLRRKIQSARVHVDVEWGIHGSWKAGHQLNYRFTQRQPHIGVCMCKCQSDTHTQSKSHHYQQKHFWKPVLAFTSNLKVHS